MFLLAFASFASFTCVDAQSTSPRIRLYGAANGYAAYQGYLSRAMSTTSCINEPMYQQLTCGAAFALLGIPGESIDYTLPRNWDTGAPFSASAEIQGPYGLPLADNWTSLWSGSLLNSPLTANVTRANYWTGLYANGTLYDGRTCLAWNSNSGGTGMVGDAGFQNADWMQSGAYVCSTYQGLLCACIPPSEVPPTPTPIAVHLYSSNVVLHPSQIGNRSRTTAACKAQALYGYMGCADAFALLGYQSDGLANYTAPLNPVTRLGFNGSAPILGPTNLEIARNWSQLWVPNSVRLERTTFAAGVFTQWHGYDFTGITRRGVLSPSTCDDWQTDNGALSGLAGDDTLIYYGYWTDEAYAAPGCSNAYAYACVCLPPGASSSEAPTRAPTSVDPIATKTLGSVAFVFALFGVFVLLVV